MAAVSDPSSSFSSSSCGSARIHTHGKKLKLFSPQKCLLPTQEFPQNWKFRFSLKFFANIIPSNPPLRRRHPPLHFHRFSFLQSLGSGSFYDDNCGGGPLPHLGIATGAAAAEGRGWFPATVNRRNLFFSYSKVKSAIREFVIRGMHFSFRWHEIGTFSNLNRLLSWQIGCFSSSYLMLLPLLELVAPKVEHFLKKTIFVTFFKFFSTKIFNLILSLSSLFKALLTRHSHGQKSQRRKLK